MCICISLLFPLKTSFLVNTPTSFLPVEALEFSELKTPLVYTFFPSESLLSSISFSDFHCFFFVRFSLFLPGKDFLASGNIKKTSVFGLSDATGTYRLPFAKQVIAISDSLNRRRNSKEFPQRESHGHHRKTHLDRKGIVTTRKIASWNLQKLVGTTCCIKPSKNCCVRTLRPRKRIADFDHKSSAGDGALSATVGP